jgi:hypothetical protein
MNFLGCIWNIWLMSIRDFCNWKIFAVVSCCCVSPCCYIGLTDEVVDLFCRTLQMLNCLQLIQLGSVLLWTSLFFTMKFLTLLIVLATLQNRLELYRMIIIYYAFSYLFLLYYMIIDFDVWGENMKKLGPMCWNLQLSLSINWKKLVLTTHVTFCLLKQQWCCVLYSTNHIIHMDLTFGPLLLLLYLHLKCVVKYLLVVSLKINVLR